MMINRHNYETFFLLYADNELSASEKEMVENFVSNNPDLMDEFSQVKDLILPAEEIVFLGKDVLFKHTEADLAEEKMLLMLDDELAPAEVNSLQLRLQNNESLAADWEILKRTKLDKNEIIEFRDKKVLYRKERDNVVVMRWVRYSVAAALIGVGLFTGYSLLQDTEKNNSSSNVITANNKKPVVTKQDTVALNDYAVAQKDEQVKNTKEEIVTGQQKENLAVKVKHEIKRKEVKPIIPANEIPEQTQLALQPRKTIVNEAPENYIAAPELTASLATKTRPELEIIDKNITPLASANSARSANLDVNENQDGILYLAAEDLTRTKAGGFLRKVKRVVERNAKIKTGDEIKIAGFSFAVK